MATADVEPRRIEPVRHRVEVAKAALSLGAAVAFGSAAALSWWHNSGHAKPRLRPLGVLPEYSARMRKQVGNAGLIDPPVASPSAATHVS